MENLGSKIRKIRKNLGLNQSDFAEKLGLDSAVAVSNYENNQRTPDKNKLIIISKLGNVSLDELLTESDENNTSVKEIAHFYNRKKTISESQQAEKREFVEQIDKIKIAEDIYLATKVLESGTGYAIALHLNIRSFAQAVDDKERITSLETKQRDFENKVSAEIQTLKVQHNDLKGRFETLQKENKALRTENKKLRDLNGGCAPTILTPDNAAPTGTEDKET